MTTINDKWNLCQHFLPPENVFVETKIHDCLGARNICQLKRENNLWFTSSGMYVYYVPTHWRNI